jgi:hypothetical protein
MNPASKSSLPAGLDPVVAAVMEQLQQRVEAKDRVIAERNQALAAAEAIIQQLKEALRLERIRKYGKQSEKLSDLQLDLLDCEPAVSSEEIETEAASGPLPDVEEKAGAETLGARTRTIPDGMSFLHIWSESKRSSPARSTSADAAGAAPRPASSATKKPRCWP